MSRPETRHRGEVALKALPSHRRLLGRHAHVPGLFSNENVHLKRVHQFDPMEP